MRVGSCRSARGVVLILIFKQYDCSLNLYDMGKGHVLYFGTRRRVQKTIWIQIVVEDTVVPPRPSATVGCHVESTAISHRKYPKNVNSLSLDAKKMNDKILSQAGKWSTSLRSSQRHVFNKRLFPTTGLG